MELNKKFKIEYRNPNEIIPYKNNAKIHSEEQVKKLALQIQSFGFDQPIVIDADSVIIKGHARQKASILLGLKQVPVIVQNLTEEEAMAERIADNKVAEAPYDFTLLKQEFDALALSEFNMQLTAFDNAEIHALISKNENVVNGETDPEEEWADMPEFKQEDTQSFRKIIVHFQNNDDVATFFKLIKQEHTDKTKSIWFPEIEINHIADKEYE